VPDNVPQPFLEALDSLRGHTFRDEFFLQEVPAPTRLAPWAAALTAEVNDSGSERDPDAYRGDARFVLLYDPDEQPAWNGPFRIVVHVSAPVESEMGADPFLGEVAWSWLTDALDRHGAQYHSLNGTVTRQLNGTFGGLHINESRVTIDIRASWSPRDTQIGAHLTAWADFSCEASGLEPDDVTSISPRPDRLS